MPVGGGEPNVPQPMQTSQSATQNWFNGNNPVQQALTSQATNVHPYNKSHGKSAKANTAIASTSPRTDDTNLGHFAKQ